MKVRSEVLDGGEPIPRRYSHENGNISPPLAWEGAPPGTKEFAIICEDSDAPGYQPWVHWLVWGIPGQVNSIDEGGSSRFKEGKNSNGRIEYSGPLPPPGHGEHHYHFKVYALDEAVKLKSGANKQALVSAMEGHVIDQGELVVTFSRQ
jgi:Raf kinase inhibitor-like YbhB/YbcL family protein